jgi:hypothetical protein
VLWIQFNGQPELVAAVSIRLREEGRENWVPHDLTYSRETYRWEKLFRQEEERRRFSYYFTARTEEGIERAYPLPGPLTPLSRSPPPPLFINEILPRPSRGGREKEFIELYNGGDEPVSADGMFLSDDRRNSTKFRITAPEPIPPKGFLVLFTDGRGEGLHANFRLGNGGEYLALHHRVEEGNVILDQLAFPSVPIDQAYGRERDGVKGFRVWKYPTPGARNIPRVPPDLLKKNAKPQEDGAKPTGVEGARK